MSYSEALEQQVALTRRRTYGLDGWAAAALKRLPFAETYWLADSAQTLIEAGYHGVPGDTVLSERMLPSQRGFVYIDRPLAVVANDREGFWLQHLQWDTAVIHTKAGVVRGDGLMLVCYLHPILPAAKLPMLNTTWLFGETMDDCRGREHRAQMNTNMTESDDETIHRLRRLIIALFLFMQQSILVASRGLAERHVRKRVEAAGWLAEPVVRVVALRRKERIGNKEAVQPVDREWSCQWVVRGHWRQQWYAKAQRNQPIWITPYVKGPEDKPLRPPRATVFAVVR